VRFNLKSKRKFVILSFIIGLLITHFYLPRSITEIDNPLLSLLRKDYIITNQPNFDVKSKDGKAIEFISFDGIKLSAYLSYSKLDSAKGTIILLHGIRANKEHFIALSSKLAKHGYNSIALDLRAHGRSEGTHCTFGVKERNDIVALITMLENKEDIYDNIGIWGQSLGAAIALQTMEVDKRIQFGIIESTFSDFTNITNDYFNYHIGFSIPLFTNYLVYRAGKIADFDPNEAKPIKSCEHIEQPILMVHGTKDQRINIQYGKANYSMLKSPDKEFIEIENANHLNVWEKGGNEYFNKVISFIDNKCIEKEACAYWYADYSLLLKTDVIRKGKLLDTNSKDPIYLVKELNKRKVKCSLESIKKSNDTIKVTIINAYPLTQEMGSTGAWWYLAESTFTLTENDSINFINFQFEAGEHASPGIYSRKTFNDIKVLF
jgi:alpha-beta hydrolase superfamily lysophospholipase